MRTLSLSAEKRPKQLSGAEIAELRTSLGLSQAQFGVKYDLSLGTIQNWEQDKRKPDQATLLLLHMIKLEPETVARLVEEVRYANGYPRLGT